MKKKAKKQKGNITVIWTGHDSWSGPDDSEIGFSSRKKAQAFCDSINAKNTSKRVPDYYETARIKE